MSFVTLSASGLQPFSFTVRFNYYVVRRLFDYKRYNNNREVRFYFVHYLYQFVIKSFCWNEKKIVFFFYSKFNNTSLRLTLEGVQGFIDTDYVKLIHFFSLGSICKNVYYMVILNSLY